MIKIIQTLQKYFCSVLVYILSLFFIYGVLSHNIVYSLYNCYSLSRSSFMPAWLHLINAAWIF